MGCLASTAKDIVENRSKPGNVGEIAVFVPGLRIPKTVDFFQPLGSLHMSLVEQLSALRTQVVTMTSQEMQTITWSKSKTTSQHGSSPLSYLQQALEEYLPILMGLLKDGNQLEHMVQFVWINQEDDAEETAIQSARYEILSVLHLMAMTLLSQVNLLLLPKTSADGCQPKPSEECRRTSIDIFLKAAGVLECAIKYVLPQMPPELRSELPVDLSEGVLRSLSLQALGQSTDILLGIAIDSTKATLAVKRRLACEMVKCWHQAQECILHLPLANGWGPKHQLFVKWKYVEAKAAAYYYHGLILDEGNTERSHGIATAALQAAEEFLKESKRACEAFNTESPTSRCPALWGTMKFLYEKIPKDASSRVHINRDLYGHEKTTQTIPALPDFAVALKPDEYLLPQVDPLWDNTKVESRG